MRLRVPLEVHKSLRHEQARLLYEEEKRITLEDLIIKRLKNHGKNNV